MADPADYDAAALLAFPANIVATLKVAIADVDGAEVVVTREVEPADPNGTVAVWCYEWARWDQEIGVPEPMGRYAIYIQTFQKFSDQEEGRAASAALQKNLRQMLYRDEELRLRLAQLSESALGLLERANRVQITTQRYAETGGQGVYAFMSVTEMFVETDINRT